MRVSLVPLFVVEALHRGASLAGLGLSAFAAGNVAALMFSGKLADSLGRRLPMLVGLVVTGGATIWLGFTGGVPEFLAAALIAAPAPVLSRRSWGHSGRCIGSQAKGVRSRGVPDDCRYRGDPRPVTAGYSRPFIYSLLSPDRAIRCSPGGLLRARRLSPVADRTQAIGSSPALGEYI